MKITLVGPGGAGKTTIGALLAARLDVPFVDLDGSFGSRAGDISEFIERFGYDAYARENVDTYRAVLHAADRRSVVALSSGFMTHRWSVHPEYARLHRCIERSSTTFVLIPSLDREVCVAEIVRRQLGRPFARSAAREAAVIRERFPIYVGLRAQKIETMRAPASVVDELCAAIKSVAQSFSRNVPAQHDRPVSADDAARVS
jgi:shikimate kinase